MQTIRFPLVSNAAIGRNYHHGRLERAIAHAEKLHKLCRLQQARRELFPDHAGRLRLPLAPKC